MKDLRDQVKLVSSLNSLRRRWTINLYWGSFFKNDGTETRFSRTTRVFKFLEEQLRVKKMAGGERTKKCQKWTVQYQHRQLLPILPHFRGHLRCTALYPDFGGPLSSKLGVYKTVRSRLWCWLSGGSFEDLSRCPLFTRLQHGRQLSCSADLSQDDDKSRQSKHHTAHETRFLKS